MGKKLFSYVIGNRPVSAKILREDCIATYEAMGMDLNTAFRMFMERTRMVRGSSVSCRTA